MKTDNGEDRRMLEKCLAGDEKSLDRFVRRFSPLIYNTVKQTLIAGNAGFNHQDIEDLHHTVFLKLFDNGCRKLKQYKGINGCSLKTWLRVVTVRIVLNDIRDKGVKVISPYQKQWSAADSADLETDAPGVLELLINAEDKNRFQKGLEKLSPRDRMFIRLYIENGVSLKDTAETMALTMGSAYTLKHRAISRLKSYMENGQPATN
jgi:RNA polymerase sigma-70 factor (ECF subfamily)